MNRDDDIIRGLGYVTIQASHLAGTIEDIATFLASGIKRPKDNLNARISDKIRWCKKAIAQLKNDNFDSLVKELERASTLFDKRNQLVHGRIYFDPILAERIVPTKKGRERDITAKELYDLADKLYALHTTIHANNAFKLLDALSAKIENK